MLLLSKKSFKKYRKNGMKTRENRISLARWKRRKSSSVVVEIVVCLIATSFNHSANLIAREFHPVWQMRKNHTFLSFFLKLHQLLRTSRFQISFHISPFQQSSNEKKTENKTNSKHALQMRLRFRPFRPIWSKSRFLKSQSKKKEWRLVSFCENC